MRCPNHHAMPFDTKLGLSFPCIYCNSTQKPSPYDYLAEPSLGLVPGVRDTQIKLSEIIDTAFRNPSKGHVVAVEAGTGVGKSLAYLIPAAMSKHRTVISTAKKSLQSQLLEKDLPHLKKVLAAQGVHFSFAPAYGKGNYACEHKIHRATTRKQYTEQWEWFISTATTGHWEEEDAAATKYKRKGGTRYRALPRYKHAMSAQDCNGAPCKYYEQCGYTAARNAQLDADIVVANHWLVGYHIRLLRETAGFRLLGSVDALIIDEAHKFEDGMRDAFTDELKSNYIPQALDLYDSVTGFSIPGDKALRAAWKTMFSNLTVRNGDSVGAAALGPEGSKVYSLLKSTHTRMSSAPFESKLLHPLSGFSRAESQSILQQTLARLSTVLSCLEAVYSSAENKKNRVCYLRRDAICVTPISVKPLLYTTHDDMQVTAYVSATLSDTFPRRIGDPTTITSATLGSAFDMEKQALLYLANDLPQPKYGDPHGMDVYHDNLAERVSQLSTAMHGNTLVLFTSKKDLEAVYERNFKLSRRNGLPLLAQRGDVTAASLLAKYRNTPNATLYGLKSFWEGIDIPGRKLSQVIVTKLPFAGRGDPVVSARREAAGDAWFPRVDLPDMQQELRQAVGRLIRTKQDRGVVSILDSRMLTKRYGKRVLSSLGFKRVTNSTTRVIRALETLAQCSTPYV